MQATPDTADAVTLRGLPALHLVTRDDLGAFTVIALDHAAAAHHVWVADYERTRQAADATMAGMGLEPCECPWCVRHFTELACRVMARVN